MIITTTSVVIYCVIALIINTGCLMEWEKEKFLGIAEQQLLKYEGWFKFGVFLACLFWPIVVCVAVYKAWRKK